MRDKKFEGTSLTETEGESKTKNSEEKDKDYSIKCEQNVCEIKYKGKIRYRKPFKWLPLVNPFGEYTIRFFGILEIILGVIGARIFFIVLGEMPEDLKGLKEYLVCAVVLASFFVPLYLVLDGISLLSSAKFSRFLKCKRCGRKNAYEVGSNVTEIRYYKCNYCGHLNIKTKKNYLNYMEPLANPEVKGKDPRL